MNDTGTSRYSWVPLFKELASTLLEYEERQGFLIDLLAKCGVSAGLEDKRDDQPEHLAEIDPFTFFSLILKKKKDENRTEVFRQLKSNLRLTSPVPADYLGVPTPNALSAWLFAFADRRTVDDVPVLWELARAAIDESIDEPLWAKACNVRRVGVAKLTQALFWVKPETYLPVDSQTRPYLEKLGLDPSIESWAAYVDLMKRVRESSGKPFYAISHEAWQLNQDKPAEFIDIRLTAGAIKNGYLLIPQRCQIFEPGHYGGKDGATEGRKFRLSLPNGKDVETDIRAHGEGQNAGRLRTRLYSLFKPPEFVPGTVVRLTRLDKDHYELSVRDMQRDSRKMAIDEKLLALAVERKIRPLLIDQGELLQGGEEAYQHHKVLPKALALLSRESIASDPIGALKGAVSASSNLLSQYEKMRPIEFLGSCSPTEARESTLDLLYGSGDLESRVKSFLDWGGVAKHKSEEGPIGFNPTGVSYLLCVSNPQKYAFCKPDNYRLAATALLGAEAVEADAIKRIGHAAAFYTEALRIFREKHDLPFTDLMHVHIAFWVMRQDREGYPSWEDLMKDAPVSPPAEPVDPPEGVNLILYGPPGTGKTYHLRNTHIPQYVSDPDEISEEQWLEDELRETPWLEVFAAALYDLGGGPVKIKALQDHRFVEARSRSRGAEKLLAQTVWSYLQHHASPDCPNVKLGVRREPAWFWKDAESRWSFAPDWEDNGDHVVELVERLKAGAAPAQGLVQRYEFVTFHQSFSYEEFVEGIRPVLDTDGNTESQLSYVLSEGIFRRICERARRDPDRKYALFIDEINRGNLAKIFGELITLIELDKREGASNAISVRLPYSKDQFSVPRNLDIIGTMNTADRSLAHIDTALRRRFRFQELMPDPSLLTKVKVDGIVVDLEKLLGAMNRRIEAIFDREHMIGHAYFLRNKGEIVSGKELPEIFRHRIIPLLTEYFFDDWARVRMVLADDQYDNKPELQFVSAIEIDDGSISIGSGFRPKRVYQLNPGALLNPSAYVKIYASPGPEAV